MRVRYFYLYRKLTHGFTYGSCSYREEISPEIKLILWIKTPIANHIIRLIVDMMESSNLVKEEDFVQWVIKQINRAHAGYFYRRAREEIEVCLNDIREGKGEDALYTHFLNRTFNRLDNCRKFIRGKQCYELEMGKYQVTRTGDVETCQLKLFYLLYKDYPHIVFYSGWYDAWIRYYPYIIHWLKEESWEKLRVESLLPLFEAQINLITYRLENFP